MHMLHSLSTPAIGDKSGEVDTIGQWLHFKAMIRVLVEPDNMKKDFHIKSDLLPSSSCFTILPIDSFGNVLQTTSFDPQTNSAQRPHNTLKCQQTQMAGHMEADEQCLVTPNGVPNAKLLRREVQTKGESFNHWQGDFASSHTTLSSSFRSQSSSQIPSHWKLHTHSHTSPESQLSIQDIGPVSSSDRVPTLVHPVPRHSPYTLTNYFASETVPESISAFGQTETSHEDHVCEGDRFAMRGSDWTTDDLVFPIMLQDRQSPGTTSLTTTTENYTPATSDGTFHDGPVTPWPSLTAQVPWNIQRPNAAHDENEAAWNDAGVYPNVNQQHDHFSQYTATDDANGLPSLGLSDQAYVQPSSLLDPYRSICPSLAHLDGNANPHPENHQSFSESLGPRLNDTTDSFLDSFGQIPYQSNQTDRMGSWNSDARNAFLIEYKRRGLSYKDIKRLGGFKEAESTLRGRFRTLTKSKEQRVRKPHWYENDVRLLCEAVNLYSDAGQSPCVSACRSRRAGQPPRVPWKKVAQYIRSHGGSYHFGNATCKKKWCEVSGRR